jgi:hypothetical protein
MQLIVQADDAENIAQRGVTQHRVTYRLRELFITVSLPNMVFGWRRCSRRRISRARSKRCR